MAPGRWLNPTPFPVRGRAQRISSAPEAARPSHAPILHSHPWSRNTMGPTRVQVRFWPLTTDDRKLIAMVGAFGEAPCQQSSANAGMSGSRTTPAKCDGVRPRRWKRRDATRWFKANGQREAEDLGPRPGRTRDHAELTEEWEHSVLVEAQTHDRWRRHILKLQCL